MHICLSNGCFHRPLHFLPNFRGIMLDPARLWIVLGQLSVGLTDNVARLIKQDGTVTGSAQVQGHDVLFWH